MIRQRSVLRNAAILMADVQSRAVVEAEVNRLNFNFEMMGRCSEVLRGCSSSTLHETMTEDVAKFPTM